MTKPYPFIVHHRFTSQAQTLTSRALNAKNRLTLASAQAREPCLAATGVVRFGVVFQTWGPGAITDRLTDDSSRDLMDLMKLRPKPSKTISTTKRGRTR